MDQHDYDVIIVGAGPAGINAAIQAGRSGARALLVEKSARLGGVTINSAISCPGLFHAWGRQIIAGTGWELVQRTCREAGVVLPDFSIRPARHFDHQICVDRMIYAALADELILDAGTRILHHAMPARIQPAGDDWCITLCTKLGLADYHARVLIDCTGDANLAQMIGYPLHHRQETQPATLSCYASGYDIDQLDLPAIDAALHRAIDAGQIKAGDAGWNVDRPGVWRWLKHRGINGNHIAATVDARTSEGRTELEIEGRRAVYRMVRFLRQQPGLENLRIDWVAPEVGVRETVTIEGDATVTLADFQTSRVFPDAVCYAFYPIDLHGMSSDQWQTPELPEGAIATIPRGALLPRGSHNFLVAGRCFSSDTLANSALRVQVPCMAMGQAAGALAALAVKHQLPVRDLDMALVADHLRQHKAIVPPDLDPG